MIKYIKFADANKNGVPWKNEKRRSIENLFVVGLKISTDKTNKKMLDDFAKFSNSELPMYAANLKNPLKIWCQINFLVNKRDFLKMKFSEVFSDKKFTWSENANTKISFVGIFGEFAVEINDKEEPQYQKLPKYSTSEITKLLAELCLILKIDKFDISELDDKFENTNSKFDYKVLQNNFINIMDRYVFFAKNRNFDKATFTIYSKEAGALISPTNNFADSYFDYESLLMFLLKEFQEFYDGILEISDPRFQRMKLANFKYLLLMYLAKNARIENENNNIFSFNNGIFMFNNFEFRAKSPNLIPNTPFKFDFDFENTKELSENNQKVYNTLLATFKDSIYTNFFLHSLISPNVKNNVGFWFYGDKSTGKSTFFVKFLELFGHFANTSEFQDLDNKVFKLKSIGKLINFDEDASKVTQFASSKLPELKKDLNGSWTTCDVKYGKAIDIKPTWTWICLANDIFRTTDLSTGDGTLDRVIHIKTDKKILMTHNWNKIIITKADQQNFINYVITQIIKEYRTIDYRSRFTDYNEIYNNQEEFHTQNSKILIFKKHLLQPEFIKFAKVNQELLNEIWYILQTCKSQEQIKIPISILALLYNELKIKNGYFDYGLEKISILIKETFILDIAEENAIFTEEEGAIIEKWCKFEEKEITPSWKN